jgi:hypothetical protein
MATLQERRLGYHSRAGLEPGTSRPGTRTFRRRPLVTAGARRCPSLRAAGVTPPGPGGESRSVSVSDSKAETVTSM